MTLSDVQARTQAIQARLQMLSGGTALAGGVIGTRSTATTDASASSFSAALDAATPTRQVVGGSTSVVGGALSSAAGAQLGQRAVALASQQIGTPYVFGGDAPGAFDCSGLVQWTYRQLGVDLPRVSSQQGKAGVEVAAADARPGDLVYFDRTGPVDHIGMYAGNGQWVVAPHTGAKVRLEPVDLAKATSIRRVTGDAPAARLPGGLSAATPSGWAAALPTAARPYAGLIEKAAQSSGLDPRLLSAVAWTESGFDASATSPVGAQGLMQIMPRTAEGLGVDALDPAQALDGGARYLAQQLSSFGGRTDLALAAYNAGPTAVRKAGGIPPYAETQAYVERVLSRFQQLGGHP